jgi:NAD(P)-dependent dehydrogenase (short-subunit alcohol dehydrogenase family)
MIKCEQGSCTHTARDRVGMIWVIAADMSRQEDIERVAAITLGEFKGRLDILVNNASTIGPSPMPYLLDYPVEDFRYVINTNLIGPFLMIKKVLPASPAC